MKVHDLCERIDAAVFTGDFLFDPEARGEFTEYVGRWVRALAEREQETRDDLITALTQLELAASFVNTSAAEGSERTELILARKDARDALARARP